MKDAADRRLTPLSHSWERGWGRGRLGRGRWPFDGLPNSFQNHLRTIQYVVIPKAQHGQTLRCQPLVTPVIISNMIAVLSTIHFDDHSTFKADKVDDIWPHGLLPLELQSHEAMGAQVVPEVQLGWCLLCTHGLGVDKTVHATSLVPYPLPQPLSRARERGGEDQRNGGCSAADFCCWPSDSFASSPMPASEPRMPVASIGSSSIFWLGDLAISFSAST